MGPTTSDGDATQDGRRRQLAGALALALAIGGLVPASAGVVDPSTGTLDDVPSASPASLGDIDLADLQYGDPAENLALVEPPAANNEGSATLSHPLPVPPGRAGMAPELALSYDSGGGTSWVGTGWDLSVGAISVDTTFGAPRYLAGQESETYELDGDRLFPNAIRTTLSSRDTSGVKDDFVRQVETEHERIIRHGTSPSTYYWQVTDTDGTDRWYGGSPLGRDDAAILTAPATGSGGTAGDFHWALSYVEDISGNVVRYSYDEVTGVPIGRETSGFGVSLYLREITYTGSVVDDPDAVDQPAYRVTFLRDGDVGTGDDRKDVTVDASSGRAVVTRDLLRGVEVHHLDEDGDAVGLARGYRLEYDTSAPFDKTLLTRVGQYGTAGRDQVHAWHEFEWFDEVTSGSGYAGFGPAEQWGTVARRDELNINATSALGTAGRGSGDGGAYIGFNPVIPSKNGSLGGSFNIAGGRTEELSMLLDLDGDALPDKVTTVGGVVSWERNLSADHDENGDGHRSRFAAAVPLRAAEIDSLGQSSDVRVDIHLEAYPVASIQVGGGFGFSMGQRYFEDVNFDGRPDFIQPDRTNPAGQIVYFNVRNPDGTLTFVKDSAVTPVPLDDFVSEVAHAPNADIQKLMKDASPRIDTIRRWVAPFDGQVRIQGAPALVTPAESVDGVRVMIEHEDGRHFDAALTPADPDTTHDLVREVAAGDAIYFRLHVIENGSGDEVAWSPAVEYVEDDGTTPLDASLDANGRSQVSFDAAADFTLFGRDGNRTALLEPGDATLDVTVTRTGALTDDVEVTVLHRRNSTDEVTEPDPAGDDPAVVAAGPADATPEISTFTYELTVDEPGTTDDGAPDPDWLEVHLLTDSPVDPTAFDVEVEYTDAGTGPPSGTQVIDGHEIPGAPAIVVLPNVRVFAHSDATAPYTPYRPDQDGSVELEVELDGPGLPESEGSSDAVITVKTAEDGVVARSAPFTVAHSGGRLTGSETLDFDVTSGADHWVEVSVHNAIVGSRLELTSTGELDGEDADIPMQLHHPGVPGLFPSANRGWGLAGYNADHPDAAGAGIMNVALLDLSRSIADGFDLDDLDEDTEVPEADEVKAPDEVTADLSSQLPSALAYLAWSGLDGGPVERWRAAEKEELSGDGTTVQAARLGQEIVGAPSASAGGRPAPEMLSLEGDFNFALGLVASISAAAGGGRELRDFQDMNGDGFPDVRSGANLEYTGPRGAKALSTSTASNPFDTSLAVSGGLDGSPVAISGGDKVTKSSSGKGRRAAPTSKKTSRGMNIGLGFNISSQWTNPLPNTSDAAMDDLPGDAPDVLGPATGKNPSGKKEGTLIERALLDVNGDGLPDRVDTYSTGAMWVDLNLGYRFAGESVQWSEGRVSEGKDLAGTVSAGFQINGYEFGGGVAYTEGAGLVEAMWVDIDGDGVPDRMEQTSTPRTIFGAGEGMNRPSVRYGEFPDGEVSVDAANELTDVDVDDRMGLSRTTGLTGGGDFSLYIGPICIAACYIVINPGIHGGYDRSTDQISMVDVDGDGYLDVVKSTDGDDLTVHLNRRGRTNLLKGVTNPLGGAIRLDYERTGNTVEQPESLWVMSSVELDDGRQGDGKDIQRSEFTYAGNVYDALHRTLLGFAEVTEDHYETTETHVEREGGPPATPLQQTLLRSYVREYRNATPFEAGLMREERLLDAAGTTRQTTTFDWQLADARPGSTLGDPAPGLAAVDDPARVGLFDLALSPRLVADGFHRADDDGDEQETRTEYLHDAHGNVVRVTDRGELETTADDTVTVLTYGQLTHEEDGTPRRESSCTSPRATASWVATPATVTVHGRTASGPVLRHRDGSLDLCANAVPIRLVELQGHDACGDEIHAVTELAFETYGSYSAVRYPINRAVGATDPAACDPPPPPPSGPATFDGCTPEAAEEADRYCVDYEYDPHRFTDVAIVTDNHGVSSSATYDPLTGRMASRTDENGNVTEYRYDPQGRLRAIVAPRERAAFLAGTGPATVSYRYGLPADGHAWAAARHHDAANDPGDPSTATIDTATFVDGIGRVVQRKRDATVDGVDGPAVIVEGAVDFDALGREVTEWYPVVEPAAPWSGSTLPTHLTTYNTWNSSMPSATTNVPQTAPTRRVFDVFDRVVRTTLPDASEETTAYGFGADPGTSLVVADTTTTDPLGKRTQRFTDVRGLQLTRRDAPAPSGGTGGDLLATLPQPGIADSSRIADSAGTGDAPIVTSSRYDALGRLVSVTDAAGAVTTHTYDLLDNRTATRTPDAGLVERAYTPAGEVASVVDEVRRAAGTAVTYGYDRDRLRTITYPDATPSVSYAYGDADAPADENVRGRVAQVEDGAMVRDYRYDVDGNVARETASRRADPFGIGWTEAPEPFSTAWTYDSLGRIQTLTYPEGEVLTHEYDLGGMPSRLTASVPQHDLYDATGAPVPQDDLAVTYLDEVRYDEFQVPRFLRTGTGVETRWEHEPARRFVTEVATDSTATEQLDGSTSTARQLQRLTYRYDRVGNIVDAANRLYDGGSATSLSSLGRPPENNVPGPAQHAYTYDGHYRLTGAIARYVDRQEDREYGYTADRAPNGNLLEKAQVTTTTGTTGKGGGKGGSGKDGGGGKGGPKKGDTNAVPDDGSSTPTNTCDGDTGSGGGSFNQDPTSTFVLNATDIDYDPDHPHRLARAGDRSYRFDANGNLERWTQPCASGGGADLVRELEWDAENRLTLLGQGSNTTRYRYSAEGARTLERGPGGTIWFVNEHWRVANDGHRYANIFLGETMVASHRTSPPDAPPPPCDPLVEDCTCDPATQVCECADPATCACPESSSVYDESSGTCRPRPDERIHFLHKDLQGSLRVATDEAGKVFQYLEYLPTGQPWVAGQSRIKDTPYLFAGGWTDVTYGLVNFGARWFAPREEQFYSPEPLLQDEPGAVRDDPSLLAAYTYAAANPLRYVDPDGRAAKVATPFDLGTDNEKHLQGTFGISDARRAARPAPAITFGGRFTNDAASQARQEAFDKYNDRAERFSTILSIETDRKRVRLFGGTLRKDPAPQPGPGSSGATPAGAASQTPASTPPPRPTSPSPQAPSTGSAASAGASGLAPAVRARSSSDPTAPTPGGAAGPTRPRAASVPNARPLSGSPAALGPDTGG